MDTNISAFLFTESLLNFRAMLGGALREFPRGPMIFAASSPALTTHHFEED
jgi:hypothetical protein